MIVIIIIIIIIDTDIVYFVNDCSYASKAALRNDRETWTPRALLSDRHAVSMRGPWHHLAQAAMIIEPLEGWMRPRLIRLVVCVLLFVFLKKMFTFMLRSRLIITTGVLPK